LATYEHTLPFGKHQGKRLPEVPTGYLLWLQSVCKLSSGLRCAVAAELAARGLTVPAPPLPAPPAPCFRCGSGEFRHTWQEDFRGLRRIRRTCRRCGNFAGWGPQAGPYLAEADAALSKTPVLDTLIRLDDLGLELLSDGRVAWVSPPQAGRVPDDLLDLLRSCQHRLAGMVGNNARRLPEVLP